MPEIYLLTTNLLAYLSGFRESILTVPEDSPMANWSLS